MAGFFDFMNRIVAGKPLFEDESAPVKPVDTSVEQPVPAAEPPKQAIRKGDDSSFPVVYVKRLTPRVNGGRLQVYARIINTWPEEIMLDKIRAFGGVRELDSFLRGNEERDFLVYDGVPLAQQFYEAQLDYKTQNEGDYFEAVHDVKYMYHGEDKTYIPDEMHLRRPIHDIYG